MKAWSAPTRPQLAAVPGRPRVFDSAQRRLVQVGPPSVGDPARMYVCGITPYDATHLGHANTYVSFDLLHRVWLDCGYAVRYVQNVTDVDDPLLERAEATGVEWEDLAYAQTELFRSDMEALRVLPPHTYVGATECINCVVALVEDMKSSGAIYQVDDPQYPDWYFNCVAAPGFGDVSHLPEAQALKTFAERGGDPDRPGKRDPLDCLVWRLERQGEPAWSSSLGRGRPGWHIECTAIALRYLGANFDVQGGGSDLVFPHHEMCAAEGVVAAGEQFAEAFVHSGMVGLDGEKMSKSLGNLVLVSKLRDDGVDPMAIRLAILDHHYRADWNWTDADLRRAVARLELWRAAAAAPVGVASQSVIDEVRAAVRDDLDAPRALAAIDAWAAVTVALAVGDPDAPGAVADVVDALLGIDLRAT